MNISMFQIIISFTMTLITIQLKSSWSQLLKVAEARLLCCHNPFYDEYKTFTKIFQCAFTGIFSCLKVRLFKHYKSNSPEGTRRLLFRKQELIRASKQHFLGCFLCYQQNLFCGSYNNLKFSKIAMNYCFFMAPGSHSFLQFDPNRYIYPNWVNLYSNASEVHCFPQNYANCEPKSQLPTQCDNDPSISTTVPQVDSQAGQRAIAAITPQNKRRLERSIEKQILSSKKNSQSNIINQLFSFFSSRQKSQKIVEKCSRQMKKTSVETQKLVPFFYMMIRFINIKRGRKYVNVASVRKFFTVKDFEENLAQLKDRIEEEADFVTIEDLCQIFRRCAKYFVREVSVNAILTSKRISFISKQEHLKKKRRVLRSINTR